jgi:hypothetical protein
MAGSVSFNATTTVAERSRNQASSDSRRFHGSQLMEAGVTLGGRVYSTLIQQGATPAQITEKVAKENGGGVGKVYCKDLGRWEIVVVQIGGMMLVKNDPKKVAEADLSQFPDPDAMRPIVIKAARHSKGGLHFGIGESGIPMCVADDGGLVFPDAYELRMRGKLIIGWWEESSTFNPSNLRHEDQKYASIGGLQISDAARAVLGGLTDDLEKKMGGAHGAARTEGFRMSDKLKLVILEKETGAIKSISEYAGKLPLDGFASPSFQPQTYASAGLTLLTDKGPLALPPDGSINRVPYLFVKTFDGKITDHLSIQFNSLKSANDIYLKLKERTETRSNATTLYFSTRCKESSAFEVRSPNSPFSSMCSQDIPVDKQCTLPPQQQPAQKSNSIKVSPKLISYYWRHPRLLQKEDIRRIPASSNLPPAVSSVPQKTRKKKSSQSAEKPERIQEKKKAKPKSDAQMEKKKRRQKPPDSSIHETRKNPHKKSKKAKRVLPAGAFTAPKKEKRMKSHTLASEALRKKKETIRRSKSTTPKTGAIQKSKARVAKPKFITPRAISELKAASSRKTPAEKIAKAKPADAKKKRAKKKLPNYFRMELLGLLRKKRLRFSRGRAAGRN